MLVVNISVTNTKILYVSKIAIMLSAIADSLHYQESVKFSISSFFESAVPVAIHPLIAAGSDRCETIKRFFGLTYDQMQSKNVQKFHENLNIDFVTNKGIVKFNVTTADFVAKLIDRSKTTVILIHGFMESSDGLMVKAIATKLLTRQDIDILALDGRNAITFEYFRSTTYVRIIGEKLGELLSIITKGGQDANRIVLIGHSLGAHIAGVASKTFQDLTGRSIGHIIALDPAGPCFSNISPDNRLDRSDAAYVDVIHTNAGILGLKEPVGHKDFYPNGGLSQPGCFFSTCDHSRAWEIFAESINSPERFPARKCSNWTMFHNGNCVKNEVAFIGIDSKSGSVGSYFLHTASSTPFGLGAAGSR